MFGMKRWFLLSVVTAALLSSCVVCTSLSMAESCVYRARETDETQPAFYRMGEQYYVRIGVRYVSSGRVKVAAVVPVKEYTVPIRYEDKWDAEPLYVMLDATAAKHYLGKTVQKPAADTPRYLTENEWGEYESSPCAPVRSLSVKKIRFNHAFKADARVGYEDWSNTMQVYLPHSFGWDVVYRGPLTAVLALGIDLPCTIVANAGLLIGGAVCVLFQQAVEPEVIQVNSEATKTKSVN